MKTKTIQFTGLALGLAIAAGSIGTASLFFHNGRQNAIDAQAEN